jgi:type II secretory pathway pseudopilin PulG
MKPLLFTKFKSPRCLAAKSLSSTGALQHNIFLIKKNYNGKSAPFNNLRLKLSSGFLRSPLPHSQTGDFLIEAIIGLVLMAIVAVGVTTVTAKVEKGKREMSVQELAVSQLRELLIQHGNGTVNLCDSTAETITLPNEATPLPVTATGCNTTSGTVNGVAFTDLKQPIVLSVGSDTGTYGKITVGGAAAAQ